MISNHFARRLEESTSVFFFVSAPVVGSEIHAGGSLAGNDSSDASSTGSGGSIRSSSAGFFLGAG